MVCNCIHVCLTVFIVGDNVLLQYYLGNLLKLSVERQECIEENYRELNHTT